MKKSAKECLKPVFNGLSKADKLKLKGSALTTAVTGVVRDDTKKSPWKYPFYAAYLVMIASPLPFFGASTLLLAGTALWVSKSKSKWAQWANGRIKASFNDCSLVREHKNHIIPDESAPGRYKIKSNWKLALDTSKRAWKDSLETTKHAFKALKKSIS